jgi:uncharacterized protein (TIGR02145 family)
MKKLFPELSFAVLCVALFAACGDSDGGANTSTNAGVSTLDEVYASEDDLPGCTEKYDGAVAFVKEGLTAFKCEDGRWENKGEYYANNDAIKNCTAKREGEVAYIVDEDKSLVCEDGKWVNSSNVSSSSSVASSSSAKSSSSSVKSRSSITSSSSSGIVLPCKTESEDNCEYGILKDSRDGQEYKTVKIGEQWWMAQNLNYAYTGVPFDYNGYTSDSTSWCYDNDPANCAKYGRLYTWAAAMDSVGEWSTSGKGCGYGKTCSVASAGSATLVRGVCPKGWHLPSHDEWDALFTAVGGSSTAGTKLKSVTGWNAYIDITNEDAFGFSALPAGSRYGYNEGDFASFWSSTEYNRNDAYSKSLGYNFDNAYLDSNREDAGFSVRCLMD